MPCPHKLSHILTNVVTCYHSLALKVTDGPIPFEEPYEEKIAIQRNFLRGKTDDRGGRIGAQ